MDIFSKDPDAVLDYKIDWSQWLVDGDAITTSTWSAPDGITIDSSEHGTTDTVVWVSGGVASESYVLTNHIVTSSGREDDRSIKIKVKDR